MYEPEPREVTFTEEMVEQWCDEYDDPNPLHLDSETASESDFGERIVPGMMLLDHLSGMLTALGEEDEEIILAGVTAARFRDPVTFGETVTLTLEEVEDGKHYTTMDFEARVEERDSLVASGALSIVVRKT